jgi:hypothetical protein
MRDGSMRGVGREHVDGAIGVVELCEKTQPRRMYFNLVYASPAEAVEAESGDAHSVEKFGPPGN